MQGLRHGVQDEEDKIVAQIRELETVKVMLGDELGAIRVELEQSGAEMELARQGETDAFFQEAKVAELQCEVSKESDVLAIITERVKEK